MPNPVEGLLEVYEDMVEVLLVLEIFLTYAFYVRNISINIKPVVARDED